MGRNKDRINIVHRKTINMSIKTFAERLAENDPETLKEYYKIICVEDYDGHADVHTANAVFRIDYRMRTKYHKAEPRTRDYPGDDAYNEVIIDDYKIRRMNDDETISNIWLMPELETHIMVAFLNEINQKLNES